MRIALLDRISITKQFPYNPFNAMETKEPSEAPIEVESDTKQLLRINKLAKTSMLIGIGAPIGGIYMFFTANYDLMTVIFLFSLFLTSAFGAFCGHSALRHFEARRPYHEGRGIAVIGIIGCYLSIGVSLFLILVLSQGTV